MEEIYETFIQQVKTWLEKNNVVDPDRHVVYQNFIGQCDQYGITEEKFYLEILRPAFQMATFVIVEDLDIPNINGTSVTIFETKIRNLKKLGQVLFKNQSKWGAYFEDMSLIKGHVNTLSSGDDALTFADIYKSEQNHEKRCLKIIYHLNPKLPYRVGNKEYNCLEEIFTDAFERLPIYTQLYNDFASGKLAIWLNESNPNQAAKISGGKSYNAFLRFVYKVDSEFPFYLSDKVYANPNEIVLKARENLEFRKELYESITNDQLFTWFDCIGRSDWQIQYQPLADQFINNKITGDNLISISVHKLIRIIDPEIAAPKLKASIGEISNTELEASKPLIVPIKIELVNEGYVNVGISLDMDVKGISLTASKTTFFNLNNQKELIFNLNVNPVDLTKDSLYSFDIIIITDYETLKIPVKLKTVFPMKTFLTFAAKYAVFGFLLFALIRYAVQSITLVHGWLDSELIVTDFNNSLPVDYTAYLFLFIVLIIILAGAYPLIKKIEKI